MHLMYLIPDKVGYNLGERPERSHSMDQVLTAMTMSGLVHGYWSVTVADGTRLAQAYAVLTADQAQYQEALELAKDWFIRAVPVVRLIHGNKEGSPAHCVQLHEDGTRTSVGLGSLRRLHPYQRDNIPWPYILDSGRYYTFEGDWREYVSLPTNAPGCEAA